MTEIATIPVIDIFAGPGGLGEGFSAFRTDAGENPFRIGLSVEKEKDAHETLRLRSFFRQFRNNDVPELYYDVLRRKFPIQELPERLKDRSAELFRKWQSADAEAMHAELGFSDDIQNNISKRIDNAIGAKLKPWVLIGGPPCQAYSIVGRVRNLGVADYKIESDHRSSLYKEYLRIIGMHRPDVFVMENVKGMLSATVSNQSIFDRILSDLRSPPNATMRGGKALRYRVVSVVQPTKPNRSESIRPTDFVVACEKYQIPQQRHRVILVGIREDLGELELPTLIPSAAPSVRDIIGTLPEIRSGLSRRLEGNRYVNLKDSPELWVETIKQLTAVGDKNGKRWLKELERDHDIRVHDLIVDTLRQMKPPPNDRGGEFVRANRTFAPRHPLRPWFHDDRLGGVCNHESRVHMDTDLARYLFAACHAAVLNDSPKLDKFPRELQPNHANAASGNFDDRFRVQVANSPSTTVTSHLSKDGHYFIHYDPLQCRSMTVREVARLQTFPDNYLFCGSRSSQYVQVGNAVPPLLACQLAACIWNLLVKARKAG